MLVMPAVGWVDVRDGISLSNRSCDSLRVFLNVEITLVVGDVIRKDGLPNGTVNLF